MAKHLNDHMKRIGPRIREARVRKGMGQQEVADALRLSKQLVSHWENARTDIPIPTALRLASVLEVSLHWLLTGEDGGAQLRQWAGERGQSVPVATPEQLLDITQGKLDPESLKERRYAMASHSSRSIAFGVWDHALAPKFDIGHIDDQPNLI
jgi:transcriptional regulator with XRE-family HTH domain